MHVCVCVCAHALVYKHSIDIIHLFLNGNYELRSNQILTLPLKRTARLIGQNISLQMKKKVYLETFKLLQRLMQQKQQQQNQ